MLPKLKPSQLQLPQHGEVATFLPPPQQGAVTLALALELRLQVERIHSELHLKVIIKKGVLERKDSHRSWE